MFDKLRHRGHRRLLYLFGEGELTPREAEKRQRLETCPYCRSEAAAVKETRMFLEQAETSDALPREDRLLTEAIMSGLNPSTRINIPAPAIPARPLRLVLSGLVIFLVGFFFVQEIDNARKLQQLERQLSERGSYFITASTRTSQGRWNSFLSQLEIGDKVPLTAELIKRYYNRLPAGFKIFPSIHPGSAKPSRRHMIQ